MILPFPIALSPPGASERGARPLGFTLAPIVPQDEARTTVRVRYFSNELAVVRYRHTRAGTVKFWRALRAWSFGILAQPAKQSRSRFTQSLKSFSSACFHARNKAWRRTHDVQRNTASGA